MKTNEKVTKVTRVGYLPPTIIAVILAGTVIVGLLIAYSINSGQERLNRENESPEPGIAIRP